MISISNYGSILGVFIFRVVSVGAGEMNSIIAKVSALILATGMACLAFFDSRKDISQTLEVDLKILDWAIYIAITCIVIGGALYLLLMFMKLKSAEVMSFSSDISLAKASEDDLPDIDNMSSSAFGLVSSNIDQIRILHRLSDDIFWKVYVPGSKKNLGYFCSISLSSRGENKIKQNNFYGACPDEADIDQYGGKPNAIYVGAIYGKSFSSKGAALAGLQTYLQTKKPDRVYARAATPDGLRILKKNNFLPVNDTKCEVGDYFAREL